MDREIAKRELLAVDTEFRRLYQEHQKCEGELETLMHRSLPSEDDETEAKRIKIHKLALKDQMELLMRGHQPS